MHLAQLRIKNFRCLKDLEINLSPGLNVIVGRNNVGKTNLLSAIRHAIGPTAMRGESLWLSRDDFYKPSRDAEPVSPISITLTFEGLSEEQRTTFYEVVDFNLTNLQQSQAHIHFEASWPKSAGRPPHIDRWGGKLDGDRIQPPSHILEALPVTFLPALRDAEAALVPGAKNRLARLLEDLADRQYVTAKDDIVKIFEDANSQLVTQQLIKDTKKSLRDSTMAMAGTDYVKSDILAAETKFERILRTLTVLMTDGPIGDLSANGLGYNNLLYIAVVLAHLEVSSPEECPLLLVEEPEAHLHPQLTTLLGEHLTNAGLQTIVTTHSPTLAASVPPTSVHVFYVDTASNQPRCNAISQAGMTGKEAMALQRMLDVTRATLYFAKGVILVEGISEAILLPVLAERLGHPLSKHHVSVIPISGVSFETFEKLLQSNALGIPAAIITDGDPDIIKNGSWENSVPTPDGQSFQTSPRTKNLLTTFARHGTITVQHSQVTLEYDLAAAALANADVMVAAWADCFQRKPGTFTVERLASAGQSLAERALCAWRGICLASHTGSKAEFAQHLATKLTTKNKQGQFEHSFEVPPYIKNAIEFVLDHLPKTPAPDESAMVPKSPSTQIDPGGAQNTSAQTPLAPEVNLQ